MDDVKKGIAGAAKAITKGGGTLIKTTRLSLSLTNEESKLNAIYNEIGKKVHEIYDHGGSLGEFFDAKYAEIVERQRRINELKAARNAAKGIITCANCGKSVSSNSDFCPKCGVGLSAAPIADGTAYHPDSADVSHSSQIPPAYQTIHEPEPETEPEAAIKYKRCAVCGSENVLTDRFCLSCGRIL